MPAPAATQRRGQAGVVLLYALIALVILTLSGLALVRGMGTALGIGGNVALRRDLQNQGEQGLSTAIAQFGAAGALSTAALRQVTNGAINYSSTSLANGAGSDNNGIPLVLLNDTAFAAAGMNALLDISGTTPGVTIRYVIDRMCTATGAPSLTTCVAYNGFGTPPPGTNWIPNAGTVYQAVYRITVRVMGPKNTMTFLQTTIGV
jgi:Tfp pilus assembly protein PilX